MNNKKKLIEKRVVVVTGGNGTIGKAIINKFKSEGAKCFAIDIKGSYPVLKCDLLNEKELKKTFNKISSKNKITDVIHAAGTVIIGEIKNSTTEEFDENINNNLKTAFLVGKTCSSKIKRGGSLTFISSQAGLKGAKYWGIYCLSKAAILRLSETLANELAHKKIRVNAVCPGAIYTRASERHMDFIGAERLDFRVRNGIGYYTFAIITRQRTYNF